MMKLLKDIATIRSGFPFRGKPERVKVGGCQLVQMRNVDRSLGVINGDLATVKAPPNWEDQRLQSGDILFTARGQKNSAGVFTSEMPNAIAASTLLVLRPKDLVFSFYLAWYLNLPNTRERLRTMQAGSSIPFIPIDGLNGLPIHLPAMELQQKIVDLVSLGQEEQALMELMRRKRLALIEGAIRMLLKKSN
jgi:hypothetical protein